MCTCKPRNVGEQEKPIDVQIMFCIALLLHVSLSVFLVHQLCNPTEAYVNRPVQKHQRRVKEYCILLGYTILMTAFKHLHDFGILKQAPFFISLLGLCFSYFVPLHPPLPSPPPEGVYVCCPASFRSYSRESRRLASVWRRKWLRWRDSWSSTGGS